MRGVLMQHKAARDSSETAYAEGQAFARQPAVRPCARVRRTTGSERMKSATPRDQGACVKGCLLRQEHGPENGRSEHNRAAAAASPFLQTCNFCVHW